MSNKTPILESAAVAARSISRSLRSAGFQMADTSNRFRWTEGFHVHRVGCSNLVSIGYHYENRNPDASLLEKRRAAFSKLHEWLDARGYIRNEQGWIACKHA